MAEEYDNTEELANQKHKAKLMFSYSPPCPLYLRGGVAPFITF